MLVAQKYKQLCLSCTPPAEAQARVALRAPPRGQLGTLPNIWKYTVKHIEFEKPLFREFFSDLFLFINSRNVEFASIEKRIPDMFAYVRLKLKNIQCTVHVAN